jgi:hypothetical protein
MAFNKKQKLKPGFVLPTLVGYLQRREQTLNEWVVENKIGSLAHLKKRCAELGMEPPESAAWDTPWYGYKLPSGPPVTVKNALVELPKANEKLSEQAKPTETSGTKKKKKTVEEGSGIRSTLHEMQEEAKDVDS